MKGVKMSIEQDSINPKYINEIIDHPKRYEYSQKHLKKLNSKCRNQTRGES